MIREILLNFNQYIKYTNDRVQGSLAVTRGVLVIKVDRHESTEKRPASPPLLLLQRISTPPICQFHESRRFHQLWFSINQVV